MSTLFFIRHGQASFGSDDYDNLGERGIRQSRLLAEYLLDVGIIFDEVFTGTLRRQVHTADEYLQACKEREIPAPSPERCQGLNEYDSKSILTRLIPLLLEEEPEYRGDAANLLKDKKSFQRVFEAVMTRWASGTYDTPGLQSWEDFLGEVDGVVDSIMERHGRGKRIGIFTSGGTISAVVRRAIKLSDDDTMRIREQTVNTGFSRFKCTGTELMMATFNEYPHLERIQEEGIVTYR